MKRNIKSLQAQEMNETTKEPGEDMKGDQHSKIGLLKVIIKKEGDFRISL
jgi:hypothetical protein